MKSSIGKIKSIKVFYFGTLVLIALMVLNFISNYPQTELELSSSALNTSALSKHIRTKSKSKSKVIIPTIYRGDCKIISTEALRNLSSFNKFRNGIPKILHYVSNEEEVSKEYKQMFASCAKLKDNMKIVLWTDASFYKFFVNEYPSDVINEWTTLFMKLDNDVRTLMIKVIILYTFGGLSVSFDTVCQKPIIDAMNRTSCLVNSANKIKTNIEFDRKEEYGESVIACVPEHPFLETIILNKGNLKKDRFYLTEYFHYQRKLKPEFKIDVFDSREFEQILPKSEMEKICKKNLTGVNRANGCLALKSYKLNGTSSAIMVHQPVYGVSKVQIVSDDVCLLGLPFNILIS